VLFRSLQDKKDKFKSKLFMKKIEFLFGREKYRQQFESLPNPDEVMPLEYEHDSASLFRCKICGRIMTQHQSQFIKCQLGILDKYGNYNYFHISDEKFDINQFVIELKDKLKTWQNVFWFLWALVKCTKCSTCKEWFRFVELARCPSNSNSDCNVHRFNLKRTLQSTKQLNENDYKNMSNMCTCHFKDHIIDMSSFSQFYSSESLEEGLALNQRLFEDLMKRKEIICNGNGLMTPQTKLRDGPIAFVNLIEEQYNTNR